LADIALEWNSLVTQLDILFFLARGAVKPEELGHWDRHPEQSTSEIELEECSIPEI